MYGIEVPRAGATGVWRQDARRVSPRPHGGHQVLKGGQMRKLSIQRSRGFRQPMPRATTREAAQQRPRWVAIAEWAAAATPPVTIVTALAVWYGYELILARGRYFGLDPSVLGFTTRDYLFRTASAVLAPLLYLLLTGLVLLGIHVGIQSARERPELERIVRLAAVLSLATGVLLVVQGVRVIANSQVLDSIPVLRPLTLSAGLVLVTYWGSVLLPRTEPLRNTRSSHWPRGGVVLVGLIVLVSVFWSFSVAAEQAGTRDSYLLYETNLHSLPRVAIYSSKALAIEGPGVQEEEVSGPSDAAYHWRYTGLRLLVRSGGNYFLLPSGWASRDHPSFVLRDEPGLRVQFQEPEEL